jgi:hypothetical protein
VLRPVPRCPETACRAAAGLDRPLPPRSPVPLRARGCAKLEKPAVPPEFAVPALRFAGRSTLCSSCASLLYTPPEARRSRAHEAFQLGSAQSSVFSIGSPYIWRTVILVMVPWVKICAAIFGGANLRGRTRLT